MDDNVWLDRREVPVIVVHGGAWVKPGIVTEPVLEGLQRAAEAGFAVLDRGGMALDAVEAAVVVLEEDPHFNAGRGSTLTSDGTVEMDASMMDGRTLDAGAVASVAGVRNPIRLARRVLHDSDHLLLAGEGAQRFARGHGVEMAPVDWHVTPEQRARFEELKQEAGARPDRRKLGTVGAVAADVHGHVAAATSTGGTAFKRPGRVGDSPLIGAGTYADDTSGAASATGHGESIIKVVLTKTACDLMGSGKSPLEASKEAVSLLGSRARGEGGIILVSPDGRAGWAMNTPRMSRALFRRGMPGPIARV